MARYLLFRFCQITFRFLPIKVSYAIAQLLSDCQYYFSKIDRDAVTRNIELIVGPCDDVQYLVRNVFRNFGKYLVDFMVLDRRVEEAFIQTHVSIKGRENIDDALRQGKGAIALSAHMGNWELGGAVISQLGYPFMIIALAHKEKRVNDWFNSQRASKGVEVIPTSVAVRRCMEGLASNKIVAIASDRDFGEHGLTTNFLGQQSILPKGPAIMSIKTGCALVPTFMLRNVDETYTLCFGKPIYPPHVQRGKIQESVIRQYMDEYIPSIEEIIRKYPDQWLMFQEFSYS